MMAAEYKYNLIPHEESDGGGNYQQMKMDQSCILKICFLVLMVVVILLGSLLFWQWSTNVRAKECDSPECVDVSAFILNKMNLSVDPCVDFYSYSCGGWESNTFIPPERAKFDTFSQADMKISALLKKILEDENTMYKGHNSSSVAKLKIYYRTCMDVDKIEADGTVPLLKKLSELGPWSVVPELSRKQTDPWDLTSALARHIAVGMAPLFSLGFIIDIKNNSRYLLQFSQSGLTLNSREEYLKDSDVFREAFLKFAVKVGKLLGGDNSTQEKMEAVYDFEKNLAEIFVRKEERIDPATSYNLMSIAEFQQKLGTRVDVKLLLSSLLNKEINDSLIVTVSTVRYFERLGPLLANTKQQVLQDYLIWHLVQHIPGFLTQPFVDAAMVLNKVELGTTATSPRWQKCVNKARDAFGFVSSALYVDETFPAENKEQVLQILSALQTAFIADLDTLTWMDEATRDRAKLKAEAMEKVVGYPDWLLDPIKLDSYYEKAEVKEGEFLNNFFSVSKYEMAKMWNKKEEEPYRYDWSYLPDEVNGFFSTTFNQIVLLAGLLQRPFFDRNFPLSFVYGTMGMISGHELTHGFDNVGRNFDQNGNLKDWWSAQSAASFKTLSQCMVDQYSQFSLNGKHFNGEYSLSENIADNGGLKLAYAAYMIEANRLQDKHIKLTGLNLSPKQLFFLGFAQVFCAHYTPEYIKNAINTDEHSISKYRILGSVANSPQFSEAFNCPEGSPSNPSHKCWVW